MLEERKAAILKAVVQEYIATAQPVGSSSVAGAPGIEVSPATVRNEMVQLERQGYLQQPHTSAGRVPTEKGYRFFVDALPNTPSLGQVQSQQVKAFFDHGHGELERLLHETTNLLSSLTNYAAVVVGPPVTLATVRSIQLVPIAHRTALAVAVLSNGSVERGTVELPGDVADDVVDDASLLLSRAYLGHTLDAEVDLGIDEGAAPEGEQAAARTALVATLARKAIASLAAESGSDPDHVFVGGAARVASAFDAVDTVREVLSILEQQVVVVSLIRDVLGRGLSVAIGSETGVQPLAECSLVVAPYEVEGEKVGTIGVLGPTRMDYPQALSAVAVVSRRLGDHLSDGGQ
jgi:heat-inducible transcriptional repressor